MYQISKNPETLEENAQSFRGKSGGPKGGRLKGPLARVPPVAAPNQMHQSPPVVIPSEVSEANAVEGSRSAIAERLPANASRDPSTPLRSARDDNQGTSWTVGGMGGVLVDGAVGGLRNGVE